MPRTNRAPAQKVATPTGLPYGQAGNLQAAQQVIPLPNQPPGAPPPAPPGMPGMLPPAGGPVTHPVTRPDVFGPTQRPNEPVTAGAAYGPGPTAVENLLPDDPAMLLRAIHMQFPSPGTREMLEKITARKHIANL